MLKTIIKEAKFKPSFIGFFINQNYFIRKGINKSIKEFSLNLTGTLLDFGCGSKPYKDHFENVRNYIGVDYKIEDRVENNEFIDVFYDGKVIPFKNDYFDSILSTEVLEHVFNIEEVLKEMNRVLKIGGKAIITTPFMWEEHEMPYDFARYTTPALKFLYEKNGFKIIENKKTGNYIEVIFQMKLTYLNAIFPKNELLRQLLLIPFIFPINFLGTIFSFILPKSLNVYFNNVYLIEKKENLQQ